MMVNMLLLLLARKKNNKNGLFHFIKCDGKHVVIIIDTKIKYIIKMVSFILLSILGYVFQDI